MYRRRIASLFAIPLLIAACSTPASSGGPSSGGAPSTGAGASQDGSASVPAASVPAASQGGGGTSLASVDLTITGPLKAGHYEADITGGGCSSGVMGPGTFSVASTTVDPAASDFDGPQVVIYDAAAAASGTDNFSAAFIFDQYATTVEINPKTQRGTGTLTLDNKGSTATITIDGTSPEGDIVAATIECHTVATF